MDFRLDDNEAMVEDMCLRFAKEQLREAGAEADRAAAFPAELAAKGLELGMYLDAIPEAQGGYREDSYSQTQRAIRILALSTGCPSVAIRYEANTEFALVADDLGDAALERLATLAEDAGNTLACTVIADAASPITCSSGKVSGRAGAVPNALGAACYLVVPSDLAAEQFVALVDAGDAVAVEESPTMGLRASAVATVNFADAPAVAVIDGDDGARLAAQVRNSVRIMAAAAGTGSALAGIDHAQEYAAERVQFGQAILTFESVARLIHENRARLQAAKHLVLAAAQAVDHDAPGADVLCRQAADVAGESATRAAIDAVQVLGGYGFVNEYPVEKIMRDVRAMTTLAGDALRSTVLETAAPAN